MHDAQKDTSRALAAVKSILDGRDPVTDRSTVLITLDHTIALLLLAAMELDPKKAVGMLHEGVLPSVEERIMQFANKRGL